MSVDWGPRVLKLLKREGNRSGGLLEEFPPTEIVTVTGTKESRRVIRRIGEMTAIGSRRGKKGAKPSVDIYDFEKLSPDAAIQVLTELNHAADRLIELSSLNTAPVNDNLKRGEKKRRKLAIKDALALNDKVKGGRGKKRRHF